jgi:ABC-2 type transport system ATP-binding protein
MIAARGLTKFYGDNCALDGLNFEIAEGEIVGILGLNGAGKTTCLRILACLLLPSSGSVTINGVDIVEQPHETRKLVGFLPDDPPLYREMTVEAYLTFAGEIRGLSRAEATRRLEAVLETTETADVRGEIIADLSHGYRQRVGIAQSMIHGPPVLILDEPISGLDPAQIKEMRELVRSLRGAHTVLLSSHILSEISQTCDRILVLHEGRLIASGTEEDLATGSGVNRLQLMVRGDREKVAELVLGTDGVTTCVVADQVEGAPFRGEPRELVHQFRVETTADVREVLAREIVGAGYGLLQLGPAEAGLESAFLQLTRRTEGAAAIGASPATATAPREEGAR